MTPADALRVHGSGYSFVLPEGMTAQTEVRRGRCVERITPTPIGPLRIIASLYRWPRDTFLMVDGTFGAWVDALRDSGEVATVTQARVSIPGGSEEAIASHLVITSADGEARTSYSVCAMATGTDVLLLEARFPSALETTLAEPAQATLNSLHIELSDR